MLRQLQRETTPTGRRPGRRPTAKRPPAGLLVPSLVAALLGAPAGARAEDGSHEPLAAPGGYGDIPPAVRHYQQAQIYYEQGRYEEAAAELERARSLDPDAPELLYNLALVYERLNELDRAIGHLRRYLQLELNDEERDRIERMLSRLEGARAHMPEQPGPETRTRVVVHRYGLADGAFWGVLATALALGAGAVATGATALVYGREAEEFVVGTGNSRSEYDWLVSTASGLALATDVLIGLGSAAAVTAILLYALRQRPVEEREHREGGDEWGPPPPAAPRSGGGDQPRRPAGEGDSDWGPAPAGTPPGGGEGSGGWGPPPAREQSRLPARRPSVARTAVPRLSIGPGAFMIAWEL